MTILSVTTGHMMMMSSCCGLIPILFGEGQQQQLEAIEQDEESHLLDSTFLESIVVGANIKMEKTQVGGKVVSKVSSSFRNNNNFNNYKIYNNKKYVNFANNSDRNNASSKKSLYNLNSRLNYDFPKPPYSLWKLDTEPTFGKTTLTGKIFLLNIAMFGLQTMYPQMTAMGAKRSDMILEGRQLYRLLTPIFLHGGIGHLMANSYSLKSMGANVEQAFGQPRLSSPPI